MYLKHVPTGDMVEILDINALINPCEATVNARFHAGEELQEPGGFTKAELVFPSDEALPRCWTDSHYKG